MEAVRKQITQVEKMETNTTETKYLAKLTPVITQTNDMPTQLVSLEVVGKSINV